MATTADTEMVWPEVRVKLVKKGQGPQEVVLHPRKGYTADTMLRDVLGDTCRRAQTYFDEDELCAMTVTGLHNGVYDEVDESAWKLPLAEVFPVVSTLIVQVVDKRLYAEIRKLEESFSEHFEALTSRQPI